MFKFLERGAIRYLIAVGRKKHTKGVIVGLSELGIKKVTSHMRKDIILFFSIPACSIEFDGAILNTIESYIAQNVFKNVSGWRQGLFH